MTLSCKIGIHSWNGCKCNKCGKTRENNHKWNGCRCTVCGKTRDEHHNWIGCTCSICNKTRDEQHDWTKDCEKCSKCGKTRENQHDWTKNCERCSKCFKVRKEHHQLEGCVCKICGNLVHEFDGCSCSKCGETRNYNHSVYENGKCVICGANINDLDIFGNHVLINKFENILCWNEKLFEEIEQLVKNGADINIKDKNGRTPLSLVISSYQIIADKEIIIKFLLELGANPCERAENNSLYSIYFQAYSKYNDEKGINNYMTQSGKIENRNKWKTIVYLLYKAIKGIPLTKNIDIPESELAKEAINQNEIKKQFL